MEKEDFYFFILIDSGTRQNDTVSVLGIAIAKCCNHKNFHNFFFIIIM